MHQQKKVKFPVIVTMGEVNKDHKFQLELLYPI